MSAGLILINESGAIQIDEKYASIGLIQSGSLLIKTIKHNNWTPSAGTDEHGATITVAAKFPLLALAGDYFCGIKSTKNNGDGTWTFQVCTEPAAGGQNIPYYIFDNATLVADEGCGLIVRNVDNELVFVNSQKPMRLVDIVSGTLPANWSSASGNNQQTWTYPAGSNYAYMPLTTAYRYMWAFADSGPYESWSETFYGAKAVTNGIQAQRTNLLSLFGSNHDSQVGDFELRGYRFLVFDVTNY